MRKNKKYTGKFKEKVVKEYLSGQHGGLNIVAKIYVEFLYIARLFC